MSLRPGSAEARVFFETCADNETWGEMLSKYDEAILVVSNRRKRVELIELDKFWRNELADRVNLRTPKHIKLQELSKVMEWKLLRGKARPLQKLVDSNHPDLVVECSSQAFDHLESKQYAEAFKKLCILKGIGQATASAILAPFAPLNCPFMADEVMEAALPAEKRDYTSKIYDKMCSALTKKAKQLGGSWSAENVGKALWTKAILSSDDTTNTTTKVTGKRESSTDSQEAQVDPEVNVLKKRRATSS